MNVALPTRTEEIAALRAQLKELYADAAAPTWRVVEHPPYFMLDLDGLTHDQRCQAYAIRVRINELKRYP